MKENDNENLLRTYGRKRAKGLSKAKRFALDKTLEKYKMYLPECIVEPEYFFKEEFECGIFGEKTRSIVEIGFGNGIHLVRNACKRKNDIFIGCEPFENGVARAVELIEENELKNIKIYPDDSRDLLKILEEESVSEFHIMFPDPWPKKKHIKRRLLSVSFLTLLHRLLKKNGCIRFASDQIHYVNFVLENIFSYNKWQKSDEDKLKIFSDDLVFLAQKPRCWGQTKYEQKALSAGGICYYFRIFK